jgi:hypothetical protein
VPLTYKAGTACHLTGMILTVLSSYLLKTREKSGNINQGTQHVANEFPVTTYSALVLTFIYFRYKSAC